MKALNHAEARKLRVAPPAGLILEDHEQARFRRMQEHEHEQKKLHQGV
jgi:hypothetical protein